MEPSEASLEEIEFLSLSPNRVAVLGLLAEESHTRTELAGLEYEASAFGHLMGTEDLMEGMTAFMGDGEPEFEGK